MKFLSRKILGVLLLIFIFAVGFAANVCRKRQEKPRWPHTNCFDMRTGSAICLVQHALKGYLLTMYNLDPEQRSKPEVPFVSKYNLAPFVDLNLLTESLHSEHHRPRGEDISKAIGAFIGEHLAGQVAQNVGASWNPRIRRMAFVKGSLLGGHIGGEVALMAYDVYHGYEYLYDYLFGGEGEKLMAYDVYHGYEYLYDYLFGGEGEKSPAVSVRREEL